jgi:hypothetical protein
MVSGEISSRGGKRSGGRHADRAAAVGRWVFGGGSAIVPWPGVRVGWSSIVVSGRSWGWLSFQQ